MRKRVFIITILAFLLAFPIAETFAQQSQTSQKTKTKRHKRTLYTKGFDLSVSYGMLGWADEGTFMSNPSDVYELNILKGSHWKIEFARTFPLTRNLYLDIGLGYISDIFRFDGNVGWGHSLTNKKNVHDDNYFENCNIYASDEADAKLVSRYVTLPVYFHCSFDASNTIVLGVIGGIGFRTSHTGFKRHYTDYDGAKIYETWGTKYKNFNTFKADSHIGYKYQNLEFFVERSLTPIFKDGHEKELYPFAFGITLHSK